MPVTEIEERQKVDAELMLRGVAESWPTPAYIYDLDTISERIIRLRAAFGGHFDLTYAVKANPNRALLAAIATEVQGFDVSSYAEVERVRGAGFDGPVSFTGPGKRDEELHRFATSGCGRLVVESLDEADSLSAIVQRYGLPDQTVLLRLNPRHVPRNFGARMAGRGSQFGIDEETISESLSVLADMVGITVAGFHCYSVTNGLNAAATAESLEIMAELFVKAAAAADIHPEMLIFGAGFGIPYFDDETELDIAAVAVAINPRLDALRAAPQFRRTRFVLELGRWIVGPAGYLLTSVLRIKISRGTTICICDAGFNANMAACGMLGGAFRRNWQIVNLTNPQGNPATYDIVGPLCTTLDHVAAGITLPEVRKGDVLAIAQSGAYGVTASPTRFISHPEPIELIRAAGCVRDVTESRANWWATP